MLWVKFVSNWVLKIQMSSRKFLIIMFVFVSHFGRACTLQFAPQKNKWKSDWKTEREWKKPMSDTDGSNTHGAIGLVNRNRVSSSPSSHPSIYTRIGGGRGNNGTTHSYLTLPLSFSLPLTQSSLSLSGWMFLSLFLSRPSRLYLSSYISFNIQLQILSVSSFSRPQTLSISPSPVPSTSNPQCNIYLTTPFLPSFPTTSSPPFPSSLRPHDKWLSRQPSNWPLRQGQAT